uniref:Uncharacterized protein n=1 Tax=Romanomermis culicivorax TaxID=13658 RepID=A0A915ICM6_ROMCU
MHAVTLHKKSYPWCKQAYYREFLVKGTLATRNPMDAITLHKKLSEDIEVQHQFNRELSQKYTTVNLTFSFVAYSAVKNKNNCFVFQSKSGDKSTCKSKFKTAKSFFSLLALFSRSNFDRSRIIFEERGDETSECYRSQNAQREGKNGVQTRKKAVHL